VGSLSVISVGFLAVLFGASVTFWLGLWPAYRSHRRTTMAAVAVCAAFVTLVSVADAVNAHFQYLPRLSDVLGQRSWPTLNAALLADATNLPDGGLPAAGQLPPASAAPTPGNPVPTPTPAGPAEPTVGSASGHTLAPAARHSSSTVPGLHPRGAVVTIRVPDAGVGFPGGRALVYLPPQYFTDPTARFPVVYLLHGSPGIPVDWLRGGGAANAGLGAAVRGEPQILVMPHLSRNWLDDSECVDGAHMKVETYVVTDLLPAVDSQLRTKANRDGRTIGGMSAGGYCALNLGLRHRDLFGAIIDMSGYTHPTHTGGMAALFGTRPDVARLTAANSPDVYGRRLNAGPPTRVYLLCGRSDKGPLTQMAAIRPILETDGLPVTWVTLPGSHTYGVWRPGLADALTWTDPVRTGSVEMVAPTPPAANTSTRKASTGSRNRRPDAPSTSPGPR
jgi:enterochelin esterase-like enzyme